MLRTTVGFLLILSLIGTVCTQKSFSAMIDDPVRILSISTNLDNPIQTNLVGSRRGGQTLYMKVTGLDQQPSNNQVMIGYHPCLIADKGVNGLYLSCDTPDVGNTNELLNLKIQIWVKQKRVSSCLAQDCTMNLDWTPQLDYIYPRTAYPNLQMQWKGNFLTLQKSGIKQILIGDSICDRFQDEAQITAEDEITRGLIECHVSQDITAGLYDAQVKTLSGYSDKQITTSSTSLEGQDYNVMILPLIRNIGQQEISPFGGLINIQGNGFGNKKDNVKVKYANKELEILELNPRNIKVQLPEIKNFDLLPSLGKFGGSSGLRYSRYKRQNGFTTFSQFINAMRTNQALYLPFEEGIFMEPESLFLDMGQYNEYVRGWFVAPKTGKYRFYSSGFGSYELYLSNTAAPEKNMTRLAYGDNIKYRSAWESANGISEYIQLEANNKYYLEVFYFSKGTYQDHLTVSVEVPSTELYSNSIAPVQSIQLSHSGIQANGDQQIYAGTYKLQIGQEFVKVSKSGSRVEQIDWSTGSDIIADGIERLYPGCNPRSRQTKMFYSGVTMWFQCRNARIQMPPLKVADNSLIAGKATTIKAVIETALNRNQFFEPIPGNFFQLEEDQPQIEVWVNGLKNVCESNQCTLTPLDKANIPQITAFTVQQTTPFAVSIIYTNPGQLQLSQLDLDITIGEGRCTGIVLQTTSIVCTMQSLLSKVVMEAGSYRPMVHIANVGYFGYSDTLLPLIRPLKMSSISPNIGSQTGSTKVTISGEGFPIDIQRKGFSLKIGSADLEIVELNNKVIKAITPQQPADDNSLITMKYNGLTSTIPFKYDVLKTVLVKQLSFKSASPYLKNQLIVTGSNFGTSITTTQVYLISQTHQTRRYQLNIIKISDTSLTVKIAGGKQGKYDLVVIRDGWGASKAAVTTEDDDFEFIVKTTSVGPLELSKGGGTLLTIQGINYDPEPTATLVIVGETINNLCEIQSITETEIKCIAPAEPRGLETNEPQTVHVVIRLQDYALETCSNGCNVTYTAQATPQLVLPIARRMLLTSEQPQRQPRFLFTEETKQKGPNHLVNFFHPRRNLQEDMTAPRPTYVVKYAGGQVVQLTGKGFGTNPTVYIGDYKITKDSFTNLTDTLIEFQFPFSIGGGQYLFQVSVDQVGFAQPSWLANVELSYWTISTSYVNGGGSVIQVKGKGLKINDPDFQYNIIEHSNLPVPVTVASLDCFHQYIEMNSQVTLCRTPRMTNKSQKYSLQLIRYQPEILQTINYRGTTIFMVQTDSRPKILAVSSPHFVSGEGTLSDPFTVSNPNKISINFKGEFLFFYTKLQSGLSVYLTNKFNRVVANATVTLFNDTDIVADFENVLAGGMKMNIVFNDLNFALYQNETFQNLMIQVSNLQVIQVESSYLGGPNLVIQGTGFSLNKGENLARVCGQICEITVAQQNRLECTVPALLNKETINKFSQLKQKRQFRSNEIKVTADSYSGSSTIDGLLTTQYQSSKENQECFIDYDFNYNVADIQEIRYIPKIEQFEPTLLIGTRFEYSTDGVEYQTLFEIDSLVHSDWNYWVPESFIQNVQKIRFIDPTGVSKCQLAEVEFYGLIYTEFNSNLDLGKKCNVGVSVNGGFPVYTTAVFYKNEKTSQVTAISPAYGPSKGGTIITLTGNFVPGVPKVLVDGVDCVVQAGYTALLVKCKTGNRDIAINRSPQNSFEVFVEGSRASIDAIPFIYANKFSDDATWGDDIPPREGDSIVVPKGETLIFDITPPFIDTMIVEGQVYFDDTKDLQLNVKHILVREGRFAIGTEEKPRLKKFTLNLIGDFLGKQLPEFGNKVLACHKCILDIHGERRKLTWTELATTAEKGATTITLMENTDWRAGEEIVITSTSWDHREAETRIIKSISADGKTIIFESPLQFRHYSAVETYGTKQFPMRAEVAMLTRNIVIQGDEKSDQDNYGGHVMLHGRMSDGLIGRIEYAEFRRVGQQRILGRYPIHFHLNGEMYDSYVIGNSVHDSFARIITVHATNFLKVHNNVGYNFFGHGVFLEDGIETNNIITNNLIFGGKQIWILLQTDITVSTFWITNPYNTVRDNRSGGSEWYGFWYEIKPRPDGPSAGQDICPMGLQLKEFNNNIAHSNGKFGLRIFRLASRKYPCNPEINFALEDPFSENPSIESVFQNFVTFQNADAGVLGEELGNVKFRNISVADSRLAGFQVHKANFSRDSEAQIDDYLIVGKSKGNQNEQLYYKHTKAIIAPRTDGFLANNVQIYNFEGTMTIFQSCSNCRNWRSTVTGGKNTKFSKIYIDPSAQNCSKIYWEKMQREIFWDLDGSITGKRSYLTYYKEHLANLTQCRFMNEIDPTWENNTLICDAEKLQIRDVLILNPQPFLSMFSGAVLKIIRVEEPNGLVTREKYTVIMGSKDMRYSWATPLATGYTYSMHWNSGINFDHVAVRPSSQFSESDMGYVLRFNYSAIRETFEVNRQVNKQYLETYTNIEQQPDPKVCYNGDWWLDQSKNYFFLCVSGKNKMPFEHIEVNPVMCTGSNCDVTVQQTTKENFTRKWSNATQWPGGLLPKAGQNVTIPVEWTLLMDIDPPILDYIIIDGTLMFEDVRPSSHLQAERMWVRGGAIHIGEVDKPFQNQAQITIHGVKFGKMILIDQFVASSSKVMAVSGRLRFVGKVPGTVWTRLSAFADAGTDFIDVLEAIDWKAGDEIVIGPSGKIPSQHEKFTIKSITGTRIVLNKPLAYDHFGAANITIMTNVGDLDMRAVVGHLTRNIKIQGSKELTNWGCRVLIMQVKDSVTKQNLRGSAFIKGVEFSHCGQQGTEYAGLQFHYLNDRTKRIKSYVVGSSFHDSFGPQFQAVESHDVVVENNVFYNGERYLVQMFDGHQNAFRRNALIYVFGRDKYANVGDSGSSLAVLGEFVGKSNSYWHIKDVDVSENVGQGSENSGFSFMAAGCRTSDNGFGMFNNTVSSVNLAGLTYKQNDPSCSIIRWAKAFHCKRGIMGVMSLLEIQMQNMIMVENQVNVVLKTGQVWESYTNGFKQSKWYISALARPDCPKCYKSGFGNLCSGSTAFYMGAISSLAFPPPLGGLASTNIDVFCTQQKLNCRVFLDQVTFHNYKKTYSGFPTCSNNKVFTPDSAAEESICANYLTKTKCVDCDKSQLFAFVNPNAGSKGWFGGCGQFECSAQWNVLVHDQDGMFLGSKKQVISNNPWFGPSHNTTCTKIYEWNGYECQGENIGVLYWKSIAWDHSKRLFSPVYLRNNGKLTNMINSFKEWGWSNGEPRNTRDSQFVGLIDLFTVVEMENAGMNPSDSRYFLNRRLHGGKPTDWVIIKLRYQTPQYIEVMHGDKLIAPYAIFEESGRSRDLTQHVTICGANNYYPDIDTIEFVVTGALDCIVRLRQVNTILITQHLSLTYDSFFKDDKFGTFQMKVAAFLNLDPSKVKVVGHSKSANSRRQLADGTTVFGTDARIAINTILPIGEANTPDGKYDPNVDLAYLSSIQTYYQTNQRELCNSLADLASNEDTSVECQVTKFEKRVAINVEAQSTEGPDTAALDLMVHNPETFSIVNGSYVGITDNTISSEKQESSSLTMTLAIIVSLVIAAYVHLKNKRNTREH